MNEIQQSHITQIESIPGSDDLFLTIPDEILVSEDWRPGDVLNLEAGPGRILITNLSKLERKRLGGMDSESTLHTRQNLSGNK